mgnify:CR=1 FL=1
MAACLQHRRPGTTSLRQPATTCKVSMYGYFVCMYMPTDSQRFIRGMPSAYNVQRELRLCASGAHSSSVVELCMFDRRSEDWV